MAEIKLMWPIDKIFITQKFGERPQSYAPLKGHMGIDLRTRFIDSPLGRRYVHAVADGIMEEVRYDNGGYGVHIRHRLEGEGALSKALVIYGHLTKPYVRKGQKVLKGQLIGLTGNTGNSTAPHLHFELRPSPLKANNGYAGGVDPLPYLPKI